MWLSRIILPTLLAPKPSNLIHEHSDILETNPASRPPPVPVGPATSRSFVVPPRGRAHRPAPDSHHHLRFMHDSATTKTIPTLLRVHATSSSSCQILFQNWISLAKNQISQRAFFLFISCRLKWGGHYELTTTTWTVKSRIEFFRTFNADPVEGLARRSLTEPSVSTSKVEKFPTTTFHQLSYDSAPNSIFLRINASDVKKCPRSG